MMEARRGETPRAVKQLNLDVRRDVDREFLERSKAFMKRSVESGKPFFLYFNHSLMHMPTIPRTEFKGKSGQGEWADCLLELDSDFGEILDTLKALNVDDNTIVVFSGTTVRRNWSHGAVILASLTARTSPAWRAHSEPLVSCAILGMF